MAKAKVKGETGKRPKEVKITLTWDEFLYTFAALSTSQPGRIRGRLAELAKAAGGDLDFTRMPADVHISSPIDPFVVFYVLQDIFDGADKSEGAS